MSGLAEWAPLGLSMALSIVVSFVIYRIARVIYGDHVDEQTIDFARVTLLRIGVVHGLIVALVFADGKQNLTDVRSAIASEGRAVSSIYYELQRFDRITTQPAQRTVARYADAVIRFDWPELAARGRLPETSWALWDDLVDDVVGLEAHDARARAIRARLLSEVYEIEDLREQRAFGARAQPRLVFWIAAIGGLLAMVGLFFPWRPTVSLYAMIAGFAAFSGLVLFLVHDLGNPFTGLSSVTPRVFEAFLAEEAQNLL